jgi:Peptidase family M23
LLVDFPLAGEWVALKTPAERVPSHGTNYFGQRYAFDFVRLDPSGQKFYEDPVWKHVLGVLPAEAFLSWDAPVAATFSGRVVRVGDGWPDRTRINALWEVARANLLARGPADSDYRPLTGNFVLVQGEPGVAFYAHLKNGSIRVREGDRVSVGEEIGRVGNSGNSTMPHLHFHVMSQVDPMTAQGLLCAFKDLEHFDEGKWICCRSGLPALMKRVRAAPQAPLGSARLAAHP